MTEQKVANVEVKNMPNLMIEMDLLGEDLDSFVETGVLIARWELDGKHICLESNGEEGDMYLELVEYVLDDVGNYLENSFSDPIYEMPKTEEEVVELFTDWFEVDELFGKHTLKK